MSAGDLQDERAELSFILKPFEAEEFFGTWQAKGVFPVQWCDSSLNRQPLRSRHAGPMPAGGFFRRSSVIPVSKSHRFADGFW